MSADTLYGALNSQTLGQLDGFLETAESFVPKVSDGGAQDPSIGFGFYLGDPNALPSVLDALSFSSLQVTLVGGGVQSYSGNVYQIASQVAAANNLAVPTQAQITASFAPLGAETISSTNVGAIRAQYAGLLSSWLTTGTATQPAEATIQFQLSAIQAESALNTFLNGSAAANVAGKSPATAGSILAGYNIGVGLANAFNAFNLNWTPQQTLSANQAIPGLAPSSAAWQAILDASYLGIQNGANARIGQALAAGDFSYVWYLLRYVAAGVQNLATRQVGNVLRDYAQSEMFGLNGTGQQNEIGLQSALEDYETFTQFHSTMVAYDAIAASSPKTSISTANGKYAANVLGDAAQYHGPLASTPPVNPILTLNQEFMPAEQAITSYLSVNTPFGISSNTFSPSAIYVSADVTQFEAGIASNPLNPEASPTIIAGPGAASSLLIGPLSVLQTPSSAGVQAVMTSSQTGNDLLVAAAGNEVLNALAGADTLIGGQAVLITSPTGGGYTASGNDTLNGGSGTDVFDFALPTTGALIETIVPGSSEIGSIDYSSGRSLTNLGGSNVSQLLPEGPTSQIESWSSTGSTLGLQYTFNKLNDTLVISNSAPVASGGMGGNTIVIDNFNLSAAEGFSGFLGIYLKEHGNATGSADAGVDPPTPNFIQGSNASYTLSIDEPSATSQEFTVTLSGAGASDFEAAVGDTIEQVNPDGTFNVTLAAGETSVAFTLIDATNGQSDISNGATLQLAASLPNPDTLAGGSIETTPLIFTYVPVTMSSGPGDTIEGTLTGGNGTVNGGMYTAYQGDTGNDYVSAAPGIDDIGLSQSGNDTVVGNGSTSVIIAGQGDSQIYGGAQTTLVNAIASASTAVGTGAEGDLIAVGSGDNTIVGSNGNDFIATGQVNADGSGGSDVIVLGGGEDTFIGGLNITSAQLSWSLESVSNSQGFVFLPVGVNEAVPTFINPYPEPYNGVVEDYGNGNESPDGASNVTIYGGTGNDLIALGNGNNYVEVGSGNSTVGGGMGDDTIIAGSGDQDILGGGGSEYVEGGSGTDIIYGGDGDNTIIGGSGTETIFSSSLYQDDGPFNNDTLVSNYVTGGSGNDLIYGSAGADTLIGGTGNVTIIGGTGNEDITGGSGNDNLQGGTGNTTLDAGGAGLDSLYAGGASTSTSVLYGGDGSDLIQGGSGSNALYAGDGGTAGAATSVFASQSDATATTTIYGGLGVDVLEGGSGATVIYAGDGGTAAAPTSVVGSSGAQTLNGGLGTDILEAGSGTAVINAGDGGTSAAPTTVISGSGADTLNGGAGPSLLEDLVSGQDLLVSSTADDTLIGTGNDTLVAGTGNDLLQTNGGTTNFEFNAGFGDDTVVGNGGTVNLLLGDGLLATDFVGSVSFGSGNNYLTLSGDGGSITLENALTGGLVSAAYADPSAIPLQTFFTDVFGGDQTIAASGYSSLIIGLANSETIATSYYYDTVSSWGNSETIDENYAYADIYSTGSAALIASSVGYDTIDATGANATVDGGSSYPDHVTVAGPNSLVTTTSGEDTVTASGSNDTLVAVSGASQFNVNNSSTVIELSGAAASDVVIATVSYTAPNNINTLGLAGSGNITATGNAGADQLTGGAGNDTLVAGSGLATLIGGSGATTFVINNTSDAIEGASAATSNTLESSVSYTLPTNVNSLLLTGTTALVGTANGANDTLTSNSGVDTLIGGPGNDTFILNNPNDVVVDTAGSATIVYAAATNYTLPTGYNSLVLSGSAFVRVTGNGSADTIVSNSGIDTLVGGTGNDLFVVNNALDVVQDTSSGTTNSLQASVNFSLPTNVNTLTLIGSAALSATGNAVADVLTANGGNDTLVAGAGTATLVGGTGNDTFVVNSANDLIESASATASNTVESSVSFTLLTNLNALVLLGTSALVGTANLANDTLTSNLGLDTLVGGAGNETFVINRVGDVIEDTATGANNTALAAVSYSLGANVDALTLTGTNALMATGNGGNDLLTANAGVDTLVAGSGIDTLVSGLTQANSLVGGSGTDLFIVNNSADTVSLGATSGIDTIESSLSITLPSAAAFTGILLLELTGSANLTASAVAGSNKLVGNAGNDVLKAGSGSDILVAGGGLDTLIGGAGPDQFTIDNSGDVIESLANTANSIISSVSYTLPTNATSLTLTGSANLSASGNSQTNVITANSGNDTLIAGSGLATLIGGEGSDLFILNNAGDSVSDKTLKYGIDTIQSSVSYTASTSSEVALVLTGSGNLIGTETSGQATTLVANAGHDTLIAASGNDTLEAGAGVTTLIGGASNDTFIVNSVSDVIQDTLSGHSNVLLSSVSITLPTNVNSVLLIGSSVLSATGNNANDSLVGNAGADTLVAGIGTDTLVAGAGLATLVGGAGSDTFVVNQTADVITNASASGHNTAVSSANYVLPTNVNALVLTGLGSVTGTGNAGLDTLTGGAGADTLIAGSGLATMIGGLGNTTFVVDAAADVVLDSFSATTNLVQSSVSYTLVTNVNELVLTGTGALKGTSNAGSDTLVSNYGLDTLVGGGASDTFVINNSSDIVQDTLASAANTAQASVSYSLVNDVNTLVLTGTGALRGTANSGTDTLVSNSGADTLVGGAGSDTFVVNNSLDVVQDTVAASNAIVASVNYTLPTDVNVLTLSGTAALIATGNSAADVITANSGNDTLLAGSGVATLIGGQGADTFVVNSVNDTVQDTFAATSNTLQSSVNFTLVSNVNSLVLTGTSGLAGTANSANDTLTSNTGVDTLVGGAGAEVFVINNAADVILNGSANDTVESSVNYSLPSSIDNLILIGTANLAATGSSNSSVITANGAADTLTAGAGATTLIGGAGNDVFVVNSAYYDVVEDTSTTASNLVVSSVSYTLPTDVDSLTLSGSGNLAATGNGDENNVITANSGNDVLHGSAFSNTLIGGSGSDTIYAGPDDNVIYAGNGGGVVYGNAPGTSAGTQSTIYGGSAGAATYLEGGPGSDVIYGGAGAEQLIAGTGYDTLFGAAGNNLTDTESGSDVLVGGAGAETLYGCDVDTLTAGSGSDLMELTQVNVALLAPTVAFGAAIGQDTVLTIGNDNLTVNFSGLSPGAVTATESLQQTYGVTTTNLLLNDGSGSIQIENGLAPGVVSTVEFSGSNSLSLTQFLNLYGPGTVTVGSGAYVALLSTNNDQDIVPQSQYENVYAFGNADTIGSIPLSTTPVDMYGSSSTVTAAYSLELGNDDLIEGSYATITGANDTVNSSAYQDGKFLVEQSSTVFDAAANSYDSIVSYLSYTLPTNVAELTLASGYASLTAVSNSVGGTLLAGENYDTLIGGSGNDTLNADGVYDDLIGGSGLNTFVLDNSPNETIQLGSGSASLNSVQTTYSYTLSGAANSLTETGSYSAGVANSANDSLTATAYGDTLVAGAGNDTLVDGGASSGITMIGGSGADTFVVTNAADVISESASGTNSVALSSISYTLPINVNALILSGAGGIAATANSGNDSLVAGAGADTLVAGGGTDTLVSGAGPDTFVFNSGFGHDLISNVGNDDVIQFGPGITESSLTFTAVLGSGSSPSLVISGDGGSVTVPGGLTANAISAVEFSNGMSYTVPQLLAPTGRTTIIGPNGNLIISVNNDDSVTGGAGHDTIYAYGNNDTLSAGSGGTIINAGGNDDLAIGGPASDTLDAVGATTTLVGGSGSETFVVNNPSTDVQVTAGIGSDTVFSSVNYTVPTNVSTMTLTGTTALMATGNSGNDVITGNSGFDTLTAGAGTDTLVGGSQADTFVINNGSDVVLPAAGATNDTIVSQATNYTLPSSVNNLSVVGGNYGTGNSGSDYLQGIDASLYAGSGADTLVAEGALYGGIGPDLLVGGSFVNTGAGIDTVENAYGTVIINNSADSIASINVSPYVGELITNVNYTLAPSANVILNYTNDLPWLLNGSANLVAASEDNTNVVFTPNDGNDTMIGGSGINVFHVPLGDHAAQTEIGGSGTNYFYSRNAADVISAPTGSNNEIVTDLNYTLPSNINQLALIGVNDFFGLDNFVGSPGTDIGDLGETGGLVGVANSGNDTLQSTGGNTLIAGSGVDSLDGTLGDTLVAGSGTDTLSTSVGFGDFGGTPVMLFNSGFGNVYANVGALGGVRLEFGAALSPSGFTANAVLDPHYGSPTIELTDGTSRLTFNNISLYSFFLGGTDTQQGLSATQFLSEVHLATSSVVGADGIEILDGTASTSATGGSGTDQLYAGAQYDTLIAGTGTEDLTALSGYDSLVAGSGLDVLSAGGSFDTLVAGAGSVSMEGSPGGTTTYVVNSANDQVVSYANDTIDSAVSYTIGGTYLTSGTLLLTGSGAIVGTAENGNDTLIANSGADTLVGDGTTAFVVNSASDVVQESDSVAQDTIDASTSYSLPANVTSLILTGTRGLIGTANGGSDTLVSNMGVDTLIGGAGSDVFVLNNTGDIIQDTIASANNVAEVAFNFTLPTDVNSLLFSGTSNLVGVANGGNDSLVGNAGHDTLEAGAGSDTLVAGSGNTTLIGGSGSDTFVINSVGDSIQDTSAVTTNRVLSSVSYSLATNFNALTLTGTAALVGTANGGSDTLTSNGGIDTLVGGAGNDTFVINALGDSIQDTFTTTSNVANSAVSYSLVTNVNNLFLTGSASLSGVANGGNDSLTGNSGSDTLTGGAGVDTLVAGIGVDTLVGGSGNTTFVINSISDALQDNYSAAVNTLRSSVTYVLPTNVNALVLTGTAALKGTANAGNDTLTSNTGIDTLVGGPGNDLFIVGNASDHIQDTSTSASNVLDSTVTFTLPTDVNALVFTGSTALHGTGNAGNDSLVANTGADTLSAGSGTDTLVSSATGSAVDSLVGGTGADLFVVNYAGDLVSVGSSHGTDTIESSVSYTNAVNVAKLVLTGAANLAASGTSTASQLTANGGADTLTAGTAATTLVGGSGNDTFVINSTSDVIQDTFITTSNVLNSSVSYTLPTDVNRLVLTGTSALVGTANAGNDTLTANNGADTLISATGSAVDSLVGGTGANVFVINNALDTVTVGSTHGVDTIQSSVSYTASANVANLTLTGTVALLGVGNSLAGTITANSGADTLAAGSGADTLVGSKTGTDTFVVNSASDVVSEATSGLSDTIQSSAATYTLPTNVQYLMLTGSAALTGTGNAATSLILGNSGNDTLAGGTGIAALEGGRTGGSDQIKAASNQAALIGGGGSSTLTGGAYKDFYAAGSISDTITTGATANVVSVNKGDGADTLAPTSGATNVLSLAGGIDTENLYFTKSGNNLVLTDGVAGDSITFTNWYVGSADQDYKTLQVVEIASASYNSGGSDPLRNKPLEEFNLTSLVAAYNAAGSSANWALSNDMASAQLASSSTADYGGDLAYYFGLNKNLTGVDLSDVQATLTNSAYATGTQTINSFSSISGGGGVHLLAVSPTPVSSAVTGTDVETALDRISPRFGLRPDGEELPAEATLSAPSTGPQPRFGMLEPRTEPTGNIASAESASLSREAIAAAGASVAEGRQPRFGRLAPSWSASRGTNFTSGLSASEIAAAATTPIDPGSARLRRDFGTLVDLPDDSRSLTKFGLLVDPRAPSPNLATAASAWLSSKSVDTAAGATANGLALQPRFGRLAPLPDTELNAARATSGLSASEVTGGATASTSPSTILRPENGRLPTLPTHADNLATTRSVELTRDASQPSPKVPPRFATIAATLEATLQGTQSASASSSMSYVDPINLSWLQLDNAMSTIEAVPTGGSEVVAATEDSGSAALAAGPSTGTLRHSAEEMLTPPGIRRLHVA